MKNTAFALRRIASRSVHARLAFCVLCPLILTQAAWPAAEIEIEISADRPNTVTFPAQSAKFIRFLILAAAQGQPCLDELEVFGPNSEANLALSVHGAIASASSCLPGHAIHQIEHLNDGQYGNSYSWIAAGDTGEWAQIELPEITAVDRVVFSRDRNGTFSDRLPVRCEVCISLDGAAWETVAKVVGKAERSRGPQDLPAPPSESSREGREYPVLQNAFLGEEYAWLKTYGRADLSPALVPYNGRVKEYPRHVGNDVLPLPPLPAAPKLDGAADDACWAAASQGIVRVAYPYDPDACPLVEQAVQTGWFGDDLYLAIRMDRRLSSHIAVISGADWAGCGIVVLTEAGLVFNTYRGKQTDTSTPVAEAASQNMSVFCRMLPQPECLYRFVSRGTY